MLPFLERKRSVSLLLQKNGKSSDVAHEETIEDEDAGLTALAEDIISAIQNKSVQDLKSCLKNLMAMIAEEDEEQDESLEHPSED